MGPKDKRRNAVNLAGLASRLRRLVGSKSELAAEEPVLEVDVDAARASDKLDLVVRILTAEHSSLRAQVVFQMDRANRMATFGVLGASGVLTLVASSNMDAGSRLSVALVVAAALAFVTLTYVGIVGEEIQTARYLRDQGDYVRRILEPDMPQKFAGRDGLSLPPVLAFEERMASRTRAPLWVKITSSLAAFEVAATALMAVAILVWCAAFYNSQPSSQDALNQILVVVDVVLAIVAVAAVLFLLRLQDSQATRTQ